MKVSINRLMSHLDAISEFTDTPGNGTTRFSFSKNYRKACDYVADRARVLGLSTRFDAVGNLRIRLAGKDQTAPAHLIVSHLDSVQNGGDYDGVLGVAAGLEILHTLVENNALPNSPIELISFVEEEGATFQAATVGSKTICGLIGTDELENLRSTDGESFTEAARNFGCDLSQLKKDMLNPDRAASSHEIHIEQGSVLESESSQIGLVTAIAGSFNLRVVCHGHANHAGTTPMGLRRDAVCGFCEIGLSIEAMANRNKFPDAVATIGRVVVTPNAPNVIPERVEFTIDVREVGADNLRSAKDGIIALIKDISDRRNLRVEIDEIGHLAPVAMSEKLLEQARNCADSLGVNFRVMHSGALHDSAAIAQLVPTAMIFVPSLEGKSHRSDEWSDPQHIESAANLLLNLLSSG